MGGAIRQLFLQNYSEGRRRRWPLATDDASSHIWLTRTASATHLTALLKQNEQKRWPHWACSGLLNTFWQALHKCLISWLLPRIFLEKPGLLPSSEDGGDGSCAAIIPPPPAPPRPHSPRPLRYSGPPLTTPWWSAGCVQNGKMKQPAIRHAAAWTCADSKESSLHPCCGGEGCCVASPRRCLPPGRRGAEDGAMM